MRSNKILSLLIVGMLLLNLTACRTKDNEKKDVSSVDNETIKVLEKETTQVINDLPTKEEEMIDDSVVDPDSKKGDGDFSHFDNTKKAWWFKRNTDNQPSSTNSDIEELIEKYDGFYIDKTDEKVLYLTFDEGYENGYTPKILDVLKENKVKAAFFITGSYLKLHPDLVKRMVDEGHIVANHTINHPSLPDVDEYEKIEEEILGLERSYYEMFQKNMNYFRPPKGEYSERTLAITQSLGYKTVFWSFAYVDWDVNNQKGADYAYDKVMKGIHNGAVILLHAVSKDNTEALDSIIKDAREKGYTFKSLEEKK